MRARSFHSVSGAAICSFWASHLTRASSAATPFPSPPREDVKEEEEEEKSNWGYTSFFPRSKTPSDCIRMNYWQLFFIAPRFWKLVRFRSGTQDREHVSKGIELFVAAIRYLSLHVNLRGYWEFLCLSFRNSERFRFNDCFRPSLCKWGTCRFLQCSPSFSFLFSPYTKYPRDCKAERHFEGFTAKHCANLRYQTLSLV